MIFLAVNFHYIGDEEVHTSGIYPVSKERLGKQIDELSMHFDFVSGRDIVDALDGKITLPERCCLLTFDDGLRCQYEEALPVLDAKGVPAMFFVNSLPYTDNAVLTVHKVHWILADADDREVIDSIVAMTRALGHTYSIDEISDKAILKYRYDNRHTASIKFILNFLLSEEDRKKIVDKIFLTHVKNEGQFANELYFNNAQIKSLAERDYLGLHGHDHTPLSRPQDSLMRENISQNKRTLEEMTNKKMFAISYPYGSILDVNWGVAQVAAEFGLRFGLTMERGFNRSLENPLLFARGDTNDVIGGKRKVMFELKEGRVPVMGSLSTKRTSFFKENSH